MVLRKGTLLKGTFSYRIVIHNTDLVLGGLEVCIFSFYPADYLYSYTLQQPYSDTRFTLINVFNINRVITEI